MERQEILSPQIDWPGLVRHVARDQVIVELSEGEVPVAKLVPIQRSKTMADLDRALRQIPPLGDYAKNFEEDIESFRGPLKSLDDAWES